MSRMTLTWMVMGVTMTGTVGEASQNGATPTEISVERTVEDGYDLLLVTVTADGEPVEGATVRASVARAFGRLVLGEETTFDDGTAFLPLPAKLPPVASGVLVASVEVTAPEPRAGTRTSIELAGAPIAGADLPPEPHRALWARHAPVALVATLTILLGGVWMTYGYVVYQVIQVARKG